ncbi:ubiquinol-cytochrome c reductase iron-sulfur subunit [Halosegnis marinus]|uniref:Ubiquinol-cytochrome c reductase iron-sulfur subunit n=1 Tax=Halosegnis marinus TaxID=3034023 RepID=A0ABD5ZRP7_9EURY|nr:ubiquinol-cytochrome c reductase iron-sulfur subunit [Halosegnis sp. DT85]
MPADEDKYPTESGRRRFVKGVVGSATLAGVGTGGFAALGTATSSTGAGGGITQYMAIENTDGPAPRGMPIVPLTIEDGELTGVWPEVQEITEGGRTVQVAEQELGGVTYSSQWFQYCGVQTYPGVEPGTDQNNTFRVASGAGNTYEWMSDLEAGEPLTVDMFDDYESWGNGIGQSGLGKPAVGTWRSEDVEPQSTMPVQVLRSTRIEELAQEDEFLAAATQDGFIAWLNKCTHFCCVPGFKSIAGSANFGAENRVYCQCHQSVYDPFSPVQTQFVALPRPGE